MRTTTERCPSCDHEMRYHDVDGRCWFTVENGVLGSNLVCPCIGAPAPEPDFCELPHRTIEEEEACDAESADAQRKQALREAGEDLSRLAAQDSPVDSDEVVAAMKKFECAFVLAGLTECQCCTYGNHGKPCTCNGEGCCHPENHAEVKK